MSKATYCVSKLEALLGDAANSYALAAALMPLLFQDSTSLVVLNMSGLMRISSNMSRITLSS